MNLHDHTKDEPMRAARQRLKQAEEALYAYAKTVRRLWQLGGCDYTRVRAANEMAMHAGSISSLADNQFSAVIARRLNELLPPAPKES